MAMYYQGSSEIQADTLQTLYLMNPNYLGYSDSTKSQPNMLFFNSSAAATNATTTTVHGLNSEHHVPHAPPQFVGLPQENIQAPRFQYNIWNSIDQSANVNQTNTPQALSLSLSAAAHRTGGGGFGKPVPASDQQDFQAMHTQFSPRNCSSLSQATTDSSGGNTIQSVIMGSKYLRAAQELLDEVANVGKGNKNDRTPAEGFKDKAKRIKENPNCTNAAAEGGGGESGNKNSGGADQLTTAQRQEIQMKKAKLINMLDEVEQRYRQYHHQMQIVVASFEQAAGIGSAKSYTQLALKTILKQFRCLKSTISAQIKALSRSLGEEEIIFGEKILQGSRLRFVDYQRRALQQLGMMHNNSNAWRPQRGLPERAVSVLRAWLFDHFLHPYPKDSDKHMLAKQTGLTRSQVSNWFINARVRLWKPMVEEMYLEEMKSTTQEQIITSNNHVHRNSTKSAGPDNELLNSNFNPGRRQEINSNNNDETARIDKHLNAALQSHHQRKLLLNLTENISSASNSPTGRPRSTFAHLITSMNMENLPEKITKKPRNEAPRDDNINSPSTIISGADTLQEKLTTVTKNDMEKEAARENYLSNTSTYGSIGDHHQLGRFSVNHQQMASTGLNFQDSNNNNNNNNFSLSLGLLPPSETSHQQNFNLSRRNFEFGTRIDESGGVESNVMMNNQAAGYEILDFQINRKPFPEQLLPADFVA